MSINVCEDCGGFSILLGQASAQQLEKLLRSHLSKESGKAPGFESAPPSSDPAFEPFVFRGIQLDYCRGTHSIWFDRGEYAKIFANKSEGWTKPAESKSSSVWDSIDLVSAPSDLLEISGSALEGLGDFVGELISGIDIF